MTGEDTVRSAERLRVGLAEERGIYERLVDHARRQGEILMRGATDELLRLAREKETELDRIEHIEREISPLKQRWPDIRGAVGAPLRERVEGELAGVEAVLRSLIELEAQGQAGVEAYRRETAADLRRVDGGRRVHQAYHSAPGPAGGPRYLDRKE